MDNFKKKKKVERRFGI